MFFQLYFNHFKVNKVCQFEKDFQVFLQSLLFRNRNRQKNFFTIKPQQEKNGFVFFWSVFTYHMLAV